MKIFVLYEWMLKIWGEDLKMSKTYLDSAYKAIDQLKSQIDEEKWSHKVKVAAITTGFVAAVTICGG